MKPAIMVAVNHPSEVADGLGDSDGIGLVRTELCFEDASREPTVSEQYAVYRRIVDSVGHRPVGFRVFDFAQDKRPHFLASLESSGRGDSRHAVTGDGKPRLFGVDFLVRHERLMLRQMEAIASACADARVDAHFILPQARTFTDAEWFARAARPFGLPTGAMLETPAAVVTASLIAAEVDRLVLGLNDLAALAFGASRHASEDSTFFLGWQPALLRFVRLALDGNAHAERLTVCGVPVHEPEYAAVLVGLGVQSITVPAVAAGRLRCYLDGIPGEECLLMAEHALAGVDASSSKRAALIRDLDSRSSS